MAKKKSKSRKILDRTFHEVKHNPPKQVRATRRRAGSQAAKKQATAIALSKARRRGARIPKR